MKTQHLALALTGVNLVFLVLLVCCSAAPASVGSREVVRCRALEIVDELGRVRASIELQPAEVHQPTGKLYPETAILRLADGNGRPEVKLLASAEGAGLLLLGANDDTQVKLGAKGGECSLLLQEQDRRQVWKP